MLDFIASTMDAGGNVPMFGDADDGYLLRLDAGAPGFSPWRSLLATGALLFRRGDFKLKAGELDDKTRWLVGRDAQSQFDALDVDKTRLPIRQTFPEGGYFVLGTDFDTPREIRLVADAGPLGYRSIAAHGHADALSFTLSVGGREVFVDPGHLRVPHAGALARLLPRHQRAQHAARRRLRPVGAGRQLHVDEARARRLQPVALVDREGQLRRLARRLYAARGPGQAPAPDRARQARAAHRHRGTPSRARTSTRSSSSSIAPRTARSKRSRAATSSARHDLPAVKLVLPALEGASSEVHRGSLAPPLGWVSRSFDTRVASSSIVWRARVLGRTVLRTVIEVQA
jgi:hypothetical protein